MKREMENLDLRNAFGPMPDDIREALMNTARSVKEEEPVKRFTVRTALIAACIILATVAAAIAAGSIFGWNDFYADYYGSFVPRVAQQIMKDGGETEYTLGPATFTVGGLYCDGYMATASTVVKLNDDAKALLTGDDPFEAIGANGENGKKVAQALGVDPMTTWAEAAKQLDLPLYSARTCLEIPEELSDGESMEDPMFNEDGSMTYFSMALMNGKAYGEKIDCQVYLRVCRINPDDPEDRQDVQSERKDVSIYLEAPIDIRHYAVPENITLDDGHFLLDDVIAEHMPAGLYLTASFTALDGATEEMAEETIYDCDFVQPNGDRYPTGMNLTTGLYTEGLWPKANLRDMISAEEIPESIGLKLPDGTILELKLAPRE